MKTVKEKYQYNKKIETEFAKGYCEGVETYKKYPRMTEFDKKANKIIVDSIRSRAEPFKSQFKSLAHEGNSHCRGFMCAYRDCANERKSKQKNTKGK